jgi:hypothetical protein
VRDSVASLAYCFFVFLAAVFVYLLAANHSRRIDLTRDGIHTLSEQTVGFLRSIETPIRVTTFAEPRDHESLRRFFAQYERETDKLSFEIYDPEADISVARRFDDYVYPGDTYAVTSENGVETRRERFALSARNQYRESVLTNALLKVDRGGTKQIYFLAGHKERPFDKDESAQRDESIQVFRELAEQRIMQAKPLVLRQASRVPEDAAAIAIMGPSVDLFDMEREMLIEYLDEGGSLLVLLDPTFVGDDLANLAAVLAHAGIAMPNEVLIDKYGQRDFRHILTERGSSHPIVTSVESPQIKLFMARPVDPAPELAEGHAPRVEVLLQSKQSVWREDPGAFLRRGRPQQPEDAAEIHAQPVAVASSWPTPGAPRRAAARIVVFGDSDFLTNDSLLAKDPLVLTLQATNWLVQRDDLLAIPPKILPPSSFVMTQQRFWAMIGTLLLIGLGILVGGISATVARRRAG